LGEPTPGGFGGVNDADDFAEGRAAVGFDSGVRLGIALHGGRQFALQAVEVTGRSPRRSREVGRDLDDEQPGLAEEPCLASLDWAGGV
jgi:hypothetical protein